MRYLLSLLTIGVLLSHVVTAQTIKMVRTDASVGKTHFITATLPFTVDISVEGVTQCTGVSFELRYNNAGGVQLAGWSAADFDASGIIVADQSNKVSGVGSINIGALTGKPVSAGGIDNPRVIHLNFVTTPDALHNSNVVFSFVNAEAVVAANNGSIVKLTSMPTSFNIHGYIDVWPGDADNNGIVDTRDISIIGLFFDDGAAGGRIRGFSRKPASTAWAPQTALAWDSVRVTYADADGSGKVDINDILVVFANFAKTHSKTTKNDGGVQTIAPRTASSLLIPVVFNSTELVLGVSANVSWKPYADKFKIIDVQPGTLFSNPAGFFYHFNESEQSVDIAVGNFSPADPIPASGTVAYLVAEPLGSDQSFDAIIENKQGIQPNGDIIPLDAVVTDSPNTSLYEDAVSNLLLYPNPSTGKALCSVTTSHPTLLSVSVVNSLGVRVQEIFSHHVGAGVFQIPMEVSSLPMGVYHIIIETESGRTIKPLTLVR